MHQIHYIVKSTAGAPLHGRELGHEVKKNELNSTLEMIMKEDEYRKM